MSVKKPVPELLEQQKGQDCPVCGKRSYSKDGVHPQCSMLRADEPRKDRLLAAKKAEAAAKAKQN